MKGVQVCWGWIAVCWLLAIGADHSQVPVSSMVTQWTQEVRPEEVLPEYPRPQMRRSDWLNLNGLLTYDRKVWKVDKDRVRQINLFMVAEGERENTIEQIDLPIGDIGNGYYRNPVLVGALGDVTVIRVGGDFYTTFGKTLQIWHSRDLVNWKQIGKADTYGMGSPWAPDIVYHNGLFQIYVTLVDRQRTDGTAFMNVVYTADDPAGPWPKPVDLKVYSKIDPGHLTDMDGNRYLYLNKGWVVPLTPDGNATAGDLEKVYDGWEYPAEWEVECFCLESPKLLYHEGYYYMISAEGGTAGPPTAHMVIAARSKSPMGPWENSPYNPMVRTEKPDEWFWRQGHGQLIDDIQSNWWLLYTGYNRKLGPSKLVLLLPAEWTDDGWPVIKNQAKATQVLAKPAGENILMKKNEINKKSIREMIQ